MYIQYKTKFFIKFDIIFFRIESKVFPIFLLNKFLLIPSTITTNNKFFLEYFLKL